MLKQILRNRYFLAIVIVAAATAAFLPGRDVFAKGQWALLYLLVIVLVARLWGARPATLAAAVAFLAWNFFFLPPFNTLFISDPRDLLSLVAFLIVASTTGYLTGRMKDREALAVAREADLDLLNRFSAHLVSDMDIPKMAEALLRESKTATNASLAALFLPDNRGGLELFQPQGNSLPEAMAVNLTAGWVYQNVKAVGLPGSPGETVIGAGAWPISVSHDLAGSTTQGRDAFIPLQSASRVEGVLYVGERRDHKPFGLHAARLIVSLANLAAVFLERRRLSAEAVAGDALREVDKLKSTLISSVSHELKTPLASASATVTNLLEPDTVMDTAATKTEIESLHYDLDRLNNSIGSLIDLSRLEAASWKPKPEVFELGEIIASMMAKVAPRWKNRIAFSVPEDLPAVRVDFSQLAQALQNVVENALIYGPDGTPVEIGATRTDNGLEIWVKDEGPGISAADKRRVFDKFFRGETAAKAPTGTGLGLAVSREIVSHHGGTIRVEDNPPRGTRVVIVLPVDSLVEGSNERA
jgi:two-component system, OmpR family, sensor histidine kinase KdpD